jgi:hypothetical protein
LKFINRYNCDIVKFVHFPKLTSQILPMGKDFKGTEGTANPSQYSPKGLLKRIFFLGKWQWGIMLIFVLVGIAVFYNDKNVDRENLFRIAFSFSPTFIGYLLMVVFNVLAVLFTSLRNKFQKR